MVRVTDSMVPLVLYKVLQVSLAGTSPESGPGVPAHFAGTIEESMPLSDNEQAAIAAVNALAQVRKSANHSPLSRGFGSKSQKLPALSQHASTVMP